MTWVDVTIVIFTGLVTFGGLRRGLILEFFDWIIIALGTMAGLAAYRPMANLLSFLGWEQGALRGTCFFLILISVAAVLVIIALILDRNYKHTLPKELNEYVGAFLAVFKGVLLSWLLVLTLWHMPFDEEFYAAQHRAPIVQWTQNTVGPMANSFLDAFSSRQVAKDIKGALKKAKF